MLELLRFYYVTVFLESKDQCFPENIRFTEVDLCLTKKKNAVADFI